MGTGLVDDPIFHCDGPVDPNRWVFHYTSLATAMMIATSGTLWLNPLSTMNDPREYKRLRVPVLSYGTATKADIHYRNRRHAGGNAQRRHATEFSIWRGLAKGWRTLVRRHIRPFRTTAMSVRSWRVLSLMWILWD
jgi:hypothetical protein